MTHIYHYFVDTDCVDNSIDAVEHFIYDITLGLSPTFRVRIKRTGRFEVGKIAAIIELEGEVRSRRASYDVYYIVGVSADEEVI